ncbi:MAG: FAD:protein FMN transferase, partial [Bacteroidales bacterium]|nr:FAD:protein FMN transferase [Bacteroidales bacterium]
MKSFLLGSAALVILSLVSCKPVDKKVMFQGQAQGTYYAVTYFDPEGRDFQPHVDSILKAFDLSVSMWVPESVISRINRGDSLVQPDQWFIDIFKRSQAISASTDGAFDITVGPLVNAWGFGFKGKIKLDSAMVDSLRQLVDYRTVRLEDGKVKKDKPGIQIDFNAIAQGYAVDVLGNFLASKGIRNYLVDIGGEVLGKGLKPDGQNWLVGIENPAVDSIAERTINSRVKLADKALATSGNYRKYYEENGIRYSHTIDPKTGYPVRHSLLSVSVLAEDAATADGYATAFMVMGFEKAKEFL